jgi:hypothetical protein
MTSIGTVVRMRKVRVSFLYISIAVAFHLAVYEIVQTFKGFLNFWIIQRQMQPKSGEIVLFYKFRKSYTEVKIIDP